uniref:Uncharacterized protein n=1 Tax=Sphaerodactylus townsendi TaxID=933632 RepID=A0ACB8G9R0_9SAUR
MLFARWHDVCGHHRQYKEHRPFLQMYCFIGYTLIPGPGIPSQYSTLACALQAHCYISAPRDVTVEQRRHGSFFNKLTADELWKGVLAETTTGRRGRGKRTKKKLKRDLNRGQIIGEGRSGFLWPGLNAPVLKDGAVQTIGKRDKEEWEKLQAEIIRRRDEWDKKRKMKVKRERGWTGNSWGGISIGPPDPGPKGESCHLDDEMYPEFSVEVHTNRTLCEAGQETYEDFDSRVIQKSLSVRVADPSLIRLTFHFMRCFCIPRACSLLELVILSAFLITQNSALQAVAVLN